MLHLSVGVATLLTTSQLIPGPEFNKWLVTAVAWDDSFDICISRSSDFDKPGLCTLLTRLLFLAAAWVITPGYMGSGASRSAVWPTVRTGKWRCFALMKISNCDITNALLLRPYFLIDFFLEHFVWTSRDHSGKSKKYIRHFLLVLVQPAS